MQIGDLVDDGLGNIGIIVELGWIFPEGRNKIQSYHVLFANKPDSSGWYEDYDLEAV